MKRTRDCEMPDRVAMTQADKAIQADSATNCTDAITTAEIDTEIATEGIPKTQGLRTTRPKESAGQDSSTRAESHQLLAYGGQEPVHPPFSF